MTTITMMKYARSASSRVRRNMRRTEERRLTLENLNFERKIFRRLNGVSETGERVIHIITLPALRNKNPQTSINNRLLPSVWLLRKPYSIY